MSVIVYIYESFAFHCQSTACIFFLSTFLLDFPFYLKELYTINKLAVTLYIKCIRALSNVLQIYFLSFFFFNFVCGAFAHNVFNLYVVKINLFFFFMSSGFGILLKQTGLLNPRLYFLKLLMFSSNTLSFIFYILIFDLYGVNFFFNECGWSFFPK